MQHGDLVTTCYRQTRALGWNFAKTHGLTDADEWRALACFQLVMAARKFNAPPEFRAAAFWAFARKFIWARLVDHLRSVTHRGKVKIVLLEPSLPGIDRFTDRSDAAIVISYAMPFLTKGQRRVIGAVLVYGIDSIGAAGSLGLKMSAFRKLRHEALKRMREVLS